MAMSEAWPCTPPRNQQWGWFRPTKNPEWTDLGATARLVDHDARVWQRKALARRAGCQQKRPHAASLPNADGGDLGLNVLHRVVDGHAARHHAAGAVDVQADGLFRVLRLEEQQLRHQNASNVVVDLQTRRKWLVQRVQGTRNPTRQCTGPMRQTMRSCSKREKMSKARSPRPVCWMTMGTMPSCAREEACKGRAERASRDAAKRAKARVIFGLYYYGTACNPTQR